MCLCCICVQLQTNNVFVFVDFLAAGPNLYKGNRLTTLNRPYICELFKFKHAYNLKVYLVPGIFCRLRWLAREFVHEWRASINFCFSR